MAIAPNLYTATWVQRRDKFELCIDYPSNETTQGPSGQPFNSGLISTHRMNWRKNNFKAKLIELTYKVYYQQRHPFKIEVSTKNKKQTKYDTDSVNSSELKEGWPEDFEMEILKPVQYYLGQSLKKVIKPQPEAKKNESVSQYFGKFDSRLKVQKMQEEGALEMNEDDFDLKSQQSRIEMSQSGLSEDTINKVTMKYRL